MSINEQFVYQLRAEKIAVGKRRPQSPSLTHANTGTSSGHTSRKVMTGPRHADHKAFTNILDEVRVKATSDMKGALVLELHTTDEDSGSKEESMRT